MIPLAADHLTGWDLAIFCAFVLGIWWLASRT